MNRGEWAGSTAAPLSLFLSDPLPGLKGQNNKAQGIALGVLALWFDGAPDIEMNEDVVGLGAYGRTLTVLHTDQATGDDDDVTAHEEDNWFDRTSHSGPWRS